MDLAGQAVAFGEHAGGVLGGGQISAGGREFLDQTTAVLALPVQGLISPHHRDGDGGAEGRSYRHRGAEGVLVHGEAGDGHHCRGDDGGHAGTAGQQVQLEEVQRERHPHPVGRQGKEHRPAGTHGGQPQRGGPPRATYARQYGAGRVRQTAQNRGGDDPSGMGPLAGDGPDGGQGEQADDQEVQAPGQGPGGRGQGGGGGVHSVSRLRRRMPECLHRKLEPACRLPAREVPSCVRRARGGPGERVEPYRASTAGKDRSGPCSSPGET